MDSLNSALDGTKKALIFCGKLKRGSAGKSDYLQKLLRNPPEALEELTCTISKNGSGVYHGSDRVSISISKPKNCSVMIFDNYNKNKSLLITNISSNNSLFLEDANTFACGDWSISDGNVTYKGFESKYDYFSAEKLEWKNLKAWMKTEISHSHLFGKDEETSLEEMKCSICKSNKKCCMPEACRHVSLCMSCSRQLVALGNAKCPICREEIGKGIIRVYV